MKDALRWTARCALLAWAAACAGGGEGLPEDPPDIVLITVDSLRFDRLGCYGFDGDTSPILDTLAATGVRFEVAVSTTSWTLPAHAALFTGMYDSAHGLVDNGLSLGDTHTTLAERLSAAGYRTMGFYGGPYLHEGFGIAQGFDVWQSCMTSLDGGAAADVIRESSLPGSASHGDITSPRTLEEVRRRLDGLGDEPLFLFAHFWDVHYDYIPPAEFLSEAARSYEGFVTGREVMTDARIAPGMSPADERQLLDLYDGEIRSVDLAIGELLAVLAAHRDLWNTLVIVTADHGEEFFEHGWKGHQRTLFDEVVRVPLIVAWPRQFEAGLVVERQVRLIDIMPTCLALLGLEAGPSNGRDLGPLLRGAELDPEPALLELLVDGQRLRGVRTETGKLIDHGSESSAFWFDLGNDPGEVDGRTSLAADQVAQELLRAKRRELERALSIRRTLVDPVVPFGAPDEIEARLESLGYAGGGDE